MPIRKEVKSILNKSKKRDRWFLDDYTLNPYSGCSFNCLYCYIRGSKYGIHMEDKLTIKSNALELLDKKLAALAKKEKHGIIVLSSATDPYLQFEKEEKLTRQMLELILKYRFPIHIITKSDLVIRDFDLLEKINSTAILPIDLRDKLKHKTFITFSFSTIDDDVAKIFEPGATPPSKRLIALKEAVQNKFMTGVSMMPLLPFITDTKEEMEKMFFAFQSAGAKYVFPASITLFGDGPSDSKTLILGAVKKHYPHLLKNYQELFADFQSLRTYQNNVDRLATELCKKYSLPTSII
jgi:DNA repair photolyase